MLRNNIDAKNIPPRGCEKVRKNFYFGYAGQSQSSDVRQCNIACNVVHVQLCFKYFVSRLMFVSVTSPVVLCMYNFVFSILFLV